MKLRYYNMRLIMLTKLNWYYIYYLMYFNAVSKSLLLIIWSKYQFRFKYFIYDYIVLIGIVIIIIMYCVCVCNVSDYYICVCVCNICNDWVNCSILLLFCDGIFICVCVCVWHNCLLLLFLCDIFLFVFPIIYNHCFYE